MPQSSISAKQFVVTLVAMFLLGLVVTLLFNEDLHDAIAFVTKKASFAPANQEEIGLRANEGSTPAAEWRVCVYNGASPHLFGCKLLPGGAMFLNAAKGALFTHRYNANTPAQARAAIADIREQAKAAGKKVPLIAILDHSNVAAPKIGGVLGAEFYAEITKLRAEVGTTDLLFMGCLVGHRTTGAAYIGTVADLCGLRVGAATEYVKVSIGGTPSQMLNSIRESGKFIEASPLN